MTMVAGAAGAQPAPSARQSITVAIPVDFAPHSFIDEEGQLRGIRPELWALWSRTTGIAVNFITVPWGGTGESLADGKADVADFVIASQARAEQFMLSQPFQSISIHAFFNADLRDIDSVDSLHGYTIAVNDHGGCKDWLLQHGVTTLKHYPDRESMIRGAVNHETEVFCTTKITAYSYLARMGMADRFHFTSPLYTTNYRWAVRKGEDTLFSLIQAGFGRIPPAQIEDVERRWGNGAFKNPWLPAVMKIAGFAGGTVVLIALVLAGWNWSLHRRVTAAIAEERKFRRALHDRDIMFAAVAAGAPSGIVLIDCKTSRFVQFNEAAYRDLGYTAEEFARLELSDIVDAGSAQRRDEIFAIGRGIFETRHRHRDGSFREVLVNGAVIEIDDQLHQIMIWTDVTERRLTEEARQESEERLRLAQEAAEIGTWDRIIATDSLVWSPQTYLNHGLDPQQGGVTPTDWSAILHPDDRDRVVTRFRQAVEQGGVYEHEYRVVWPDGQIRWLAGRGRAIRDPESGKVVRVIGVNRDLTEQRTAQQEVLRARTEVLHAARLSTIGEVASTIAHEINQPIGAASNYINTARILSSDPKLNDLLDHGLDQIQRAAITITKVKDFAANRRLDRRPEAIEPLIQDACFLGLLGNSRHRISVTVDVPADLPEILVNRVQIEQVLVNVILNAADSLSESVHGKIRISVQPSEDASMLEIVVADNGPGFSAEVIPNLFQPFMTTKPNGTGLGLSTSLSITRSHGGNLRAEPGADGGAVFRITLPVAETSNG